MKTQNRPLKVALWILVTVLLLAFVFFINPKLYRDLIGASRANLTKKELDKAMDQLISNGDYHAIITDLKGGQNDLEMMFGSSRAREVVQSIEKLPETDRTAKCGELFSKAILAETNAIYAVFKHEDDPSSPPNQQSLLSTREAVGLAMFATADIGRRDLLSGQFAHLDHLRSELELLVLARQSAHPQDPAFILMDYALPDNRFQVNVLRLAAIRASGNKEMQKQVEAECQLASMKTSIMQFGDWDTRPTAFERFSQSPVAEKLGIHPVTLSKKSNGSTQYTIYDWKDADDIFVHKNQEEEFIRELRSIVLR